MKVCHMTSVHNAEDVRIFHKECISLANAGYDVYLVARGDSYEKNGVHIVGVGEIRGNRLERMTAGAKRVYEKALELDCDIYHFHDAELLPYGHKLKKKGKKVIFDSHENTVEDIREKKWIPSIVRKPLYVVFDYYQKHICKSLDAVVSVTPHICDYFHAINPNTYMVTNYPILEPMQVKSDQFEKTLCFAGAIVPEWMHHRIIQAMGKIDGCRYVLCGKEYSGYISQLKELPGWSKVDYRGFLPHKEINALLASCQIGMAVHAYDHNTGLKIGTMGNTKVFEEMMAGLPVVCTAYDLWSEFVNRYQCGICVDPENTDEIAEAICYLLDHPDEAKKMGENGRRAVEVEFNWDIEKEKLLALYDDIKSNSK